jgi:hypothetical protein
LPVSKGSNKKTRNNKVKKMRPYLFFSSRSVVDITQILLPKMPEGLKTRKSVNMAKEKTSVNLGDTIKPVNVSSHPKKNAARMLPGRLPMPPMTTMTKAFIRGISHIRGVMDKMGEIMAPATAARKVETNMTNLKTCSGSIPTKRAPSSLMETDSVAIPYFVLVKTNHRANRTHKVIGMIRIWCQLTVTPKRLVVPLTRLGIFWPRGPNRSNMPSSAAKATATVRTKT